MIHDIKLNDIYILTGIPWPEYDFFVIGEKYSINIIDYPCINVKRISNGTSMGGILTSRITGEYEGFPICFKKVNKQMIIIGEDNGKE